MRIENHEAVMKEVLEEISEALKDKRGLLAHQRRLAFALSMGAANLLELYFHRLQIIKEGSKINHLWFKRRKELINEYIQKQITSPIGSVQNIWQIIDIIVKIEERRDDIAYGAPSSEKLLQEKINLFFELRRMTGC